MGAGKKMGQGALNMGGRALTAVQRRCIVERGYNGAPREAGKKDNRRQCGACPRVHMFFDKLLDLGIHSGRGGGGALKSTTKEVYAQSMHGKPEH